MPLRVIQQTYVDLPYHGFHYMEAVNRREILRLTHVKEWLYLKKIVANLNPRAKIYVFLMPRYK